MSETASRHEDVPAYSNDFAASSTDAKFSNNLWNPTIWNASIEKVHCLLIALILDIFFLELQELTH